jgi:hypothetical protein
VTAIGETLVDRIKALEAQRVGLDGRFARIDAENGGEKVVSLHPAALDRFRHNVETIHAALTGGLEVEEMAPFRAAFGTYLSGSWFMKPAARSGMK